MKTLSALLFTCAFAGTVRAQQLAPASAAGSTPDDGRNAPDAASHKPPRTQGQAKAAITNLGEAGNVYTILYSSQNQVSYDPATNSVIFVHRQDPGGFNNVGGNGTLRFDVSTDGGANWTLDRLLTPNIFDGSADSIIGVRYPNATLYNPPGNSDPANAVVVSTGMALSTLDTSLHVVNTGFLQRSSARLDGTGATCAFTDFYGDRTTYATFGLVINSDGTLWDLSSRQSNDTLNADTIGFKDFRINKGIWNTGTQQVDWTDVATLNPQMVVYGDYNGSDRKTTEVQNWNMAFAPDGLIGYAVIVGKEYDGIPTGPMPLVWKTTDGGTNWNQLPNHDFSQEPWMQENIAGTIDTGEPRPFFTDNDITVDANGTLHMVGTVISQYRANSPDSAGFYFADLATQFILHLSTSDGVTWAVEKLSDKLQNDHAYAVNTMVFKPVQGDRPQASRTADGSHVFFTWNQSEDGDLEILFPEIHGMGYDVANDRWTEAKSLSAGTDADAVAWWHTVSPTCIVDGDDYDFELPTAFADPDTYADSPSGFTYIKGIGFNQDEFVVGVEEIGNLGSLSVFPNPSEGRFTLSLVNTGTVDIRVADLTGRAVRTFRTNGAQAQLDLNNEPAGIYTLTVTSEKSLFSRKLVVH